MNRRTFRRGVAEAVRTAVICGIAALVANLAAIGTTGPVWGLVWTAVMVLTAFALWTLADAARRALGGRS